jgi:hypothetical protein
MGEPSEEENSWRRGERPLHERAGNGTRMQDADTVSTNEREDRRTSR